LHDRFETINSIFKNLRNFAKFPSTHACILLLGHHKKHNTSHNSWHQAFAGTPSKENAWIKVSSSTYLLYPVPAKALHYPSI